MFYLYKHSLLIANFPELWVEFYNSLQRVFWYDSSCFTLNIFRSHEKHWEWKYNGDLLLNYPINFFQPLSQFLMDDFSNTNGKEEDRRRREEGFIIYFLNVVFMFWLCIEVTRSQQTRHQLTTHYSLPSYWFISSSDNVNKIYHQLAKITKLAAPAQVNHF